MQGQQLPTAPRFTELEQAKLETCQARRTAFAAQRVAISLAERDNDEAEQAIVMGARARTDAEDAEAAAKAKAAGVQTTDGIGNAEVVELRPGGPTEASVAA